MSPRKAKEEAVTDPSVYRLDFLKAHTVYKNGAGEKIPGVTTVIGILDKPALIPWANRLGLQGIEVGKFVGKAADIGTVAHAMCEAWLTGRVLDESNIAPDTVEAARFGFERFKEWWAEQKFTLEHSEVRLLSERWQVGGTADIVARDQDGRRWLVDIKTCSGIWREHKIQVSAYAAMFEEQGEFEFIDRVALVRIGKEEVGDVEPHLLGDAERRLCAEVFGKLADLYFVLKRVK